MPKVWNAASATNRQISTGSMEVPRVSIQMGARAPSILNGAIAVLLSDYEILKERVLQAAVRLSAQIERQGYGGHDAVIELRRAIAELKKAEK